MYFLICLRSYFFLDVCEIPFLSSLCCSFSCIYLFSAFCFVRYSFIYVRVALYMCFFLYVVRSSGACSFLFIYVFNYYFLKK